MPFVNYAEDCIHLHACRRMQCVAKSKGFTYARGCDSETCTAYVSGGEKKYISVEDARDTARYLYSERANPYELYCACDFNGKTLGELIEEETEECLKS